MLTINLEGLEPRISGVRSSLSTNCVNSTNWPLPRYLQNVIQPGYLADTTTIYFNKKALNVFAEIFTGCGVFTSLVREN